LNAKYQFYIQECDYFLREKEQNEEFLKHIEEDTEHQLVTQAEKIRNEEKELWSNEKKSLILNYDSEISTLKSCLNQYETVIIYI
jgi:hypothetical protein